MVGVFRYWWWVSLGVIHGWCIQVLVVGESGGHPWLVYSCIGGG